jgi:hypothetical protein
MKAFVLQFINIASQFRTVVSALCGAHPQLSVALLCNERFTSARFRRDADAIWAEIGVVSGALALMTNIVMANRDRQRPILWRHNQGGGIRPIRFNLMSPVVGIDQPLPRYSVGDSVTGMNQFIARWPEDPRSSC